MTAKEIENLNELIDNLRKIGAFDTATEYAIKREELKKKLGGIKYGK